MSLQTRRTDWVWINCNSFNCISGEQYNRNDQVVLLPIVDGLNNRPPYLPLGIPEDISEKIIQLQSDPSAWWVGQFAKYLWRPQQWLLDDMAETRRKLNIEKPIVG